MNKLIELWNWLLGNESKPLPKSTGRGKLCKDLPTDIKLPKKGFQKRGKK